MLNEDLTVQFTHDYNLVDKCGRLELIRFYCNLKIIQIPILFDSTWFDLKINVMIYTQIIMLILFYNLCTNL